MTDFHRNIFSYFMGASQPDQDRQRQLEDNTTKALVNTLEHCRPNVAVKFLEWLGVSKPRNVKYVQQKGTIGDERILAKNQRLLLAIVGTLPDDQNVFDQLPKTSCGSSRPDAWLYGDDFVVLIESKVGDTKLDSNQLACHRDKLHPKDCKVLSWAEVHEFFVGLSEGLSDPRSKWLTGQFTQFLEWMGMTKFVGFKEEMFEFFVASERDPDTKRWVRGAVEGLGDKLLNGKGGLKSINSFYSDKHVGNLPDNSDHYWVAFGPATDFRKKAHQTVSLYEQKLDVFVNVELLPPIQRLRKKIESGGFRKAMCELPRPFTVHIQERKATKQPRLFDYIHIADIAAGTYKGSRYGLKNTSSPEFDYIESLLVNTRYPYLSVRRSIDRSEVLSLSKPNGDALVAEVVNIMRGFHPLVEFINE